MKKESHSSGMINTPMSHSAHSSKSNQKMFNSLTPKQTKESRLMNKKVPARSQTTEVILTPTRSNILSSKDRKQNENVKKHESEVKVKKFDEDKDENIKEQEERRMKNEIMKAIA